MFPLCRNGHIGPHYVGMVMYSFHQWKIWSQLMRLLLGLCAKILLPRFLLLQQLKVLQQINMTQDICDILTIVKHQEKRVSYFCTTVFLQTTL